MKIHEIRVMRTVLEEYPALPAHESLCRAFHIVEKVKELLDQGTPGAVVLELIEEMECGEKA